MFLGLNKDLLLTLQQQLIKARPHRHIVVNMKQYFKEVLNLVQKLKRRDIAVIVKDFSVHLELQDDVAGTQTQFLEVRDVSVENYMVRVVIVIQYFVTRWQQWSN